MTEQEQFTRAKRDLVAALKDTGVYAGLESMVVYLTNLFTSATPKWPPFEVRPTCLKCGYRPTLGEVPMRYVRHLGFELMERTCTRCGAQWFTQCADAEELVK